MQNTVGAITLFVADPQRSKEFYARVFTAEQVYTDDVSTVFKFENTLVNVLQATEATALIAPAAVGSGSTFQLTIWVADADATVAELRGRGVEFLNGPIDRPWGQRTAAFADPDGHVWEIAQSLNT